MEVGVQMIFQKWGYDDSISDSRIFDEEIRLGILADELGFDALWPVEHHFEDYSFCPDNAQFLFYMAAKTEQIKLATGAVILPWNQPLRVAEKIAMLDELSGGRVIFGMGRGLSRREYEVFGIDMATSRDRFDEAAAMILNGLETGYVEGDGPYYPQPRARIRPVPTRSFRGRVSAVAMSPDSLEQAARLGVRMVVFSQKPFERLADDINRFGDLFRTFHDYEPVPPPTVCDFLYCHADRADAEERARGYMSGYLSSVLHHYELASDHYKDTKGYEIYGRQADTIQRIGPEELYEMYLSVQAWGTPDQILEKYATRQALIGPFQITNCFRFAGMPYEEAEASMRLYAAEVLPEIRRMEQAETAE